MSRRWIGRAGAVMAVGVVFLSGCASSPPLQEQATTKMLAPMSQPERAVGYKVIRIRDGREEVNTLVAQTAGRDVPQPGCPCPSPHGVRPGTRIHQL
jgi:hypothetical protein